MTSRELSFVFDRLRLLIVLSLVVPLGACELSLDGSNPRREVTRPHFVVTDVSVDNGATEIPLNQPITLTFSEYLDPSSFDYFNAVRLRSGSIGGTGWARYSIVDRSLTWYPTRSLHPNLIYTVKVNPDTVRSIFGEELALEFGIRFETSTDATMEQNRRLELVSYDDTIQPIFEQGCSCHVENERLPQLGYEDLVAIPSSQQEGRTLVVPFEPAVSYLMHKLLDDHPYRRLEVMPPSWSTSPRLEDDDLRQIERWIATGAGR